jgi:hypothetical protein
MFLGIALDRLVSCLKPENEARPRITAEVRIVDEANSLDSQPTGLLSAFVAAHSIGDDGESSFAAKHGLRFRFPIEVGVFVVSPEQSDVRQACGLESWLWMRGVNRHKLGNASGLARIAQLESAIERATTSPFEFRHYKG